MSSTAAIRGVLGVTPFRRLWYATALSSLGDWLGLLATTALATSLATGYQAQNYALGGVLVVRLLPAMILGPLAGVFADRFDRRRTMIVSDFVRFVLFLSIPLAPLFLTQDQSLLWLIVITFVIECVSLFWLPAKDASVPNLVRRDQVEAANQLSLVTTYGLTPVAGAGLFSFLSLITNVLARHVHFFADKPTQLALYFNAITFLVGALVVVFVPEIGGPSAGRRAAQTSDEQPTLRSLVREGASFIRNSSLVGGLMTGLLGAFAAAGGVIGAGRTFVATLGGGNAAYGVLFGSVFVGLGTGMAFGPRIARDLSRRRLFGLAIVFAGACLFAAAIMPQIALATVFVIGIGFGGGTAYLAGVTLLGTDVDDQLRGRVFALLQSLMRVILILALAAVPFLVAQIGPHRLTIGAFVYVVDGTRVVLLVGGILAVLAGVFAYRKMDDRQEVGIWTDLTTALRGDSVSRRRMRTGGLLVAFEGGEGSGKSTQVRLLAEAFREVGHPVVVTHEPGGTAVGAEIRRLLLHHDEPLTARSEALLFAADRAQHVETVIRPSLEAGKVVLTDRYVDSSLAYQGVARDLSIEEVGRISRWATQGLRADLTVLLDLPVAEGLARASGRGAADKLEQESLVFHERVRGAFRVLAESSPRRYLVVDARRSPEEIAALVFEAVYRLVSPPRRALFHQHSGRTPLVVPDLPAAGQPPTRASLEQFEGQDAR
jgi:dTMP kinase